MRKFKILLVLLLCLSMVLLCSCGAATSEDYSSQSYDSSASYESETSYEESPQAVLDSKSYAAEEAADESGEGEDSSSQHGLKIIRTSTLNVETMDFEASYAAIMQALEDVKGYIGYSSQRGGDSYYGYSARYAEMQLRVPSAQYDNFLNASGTFGTVTSRTDNTQDITTAYLDTEARIASLKQQEQRLMELQAQAATLEDLLTIENQLTQVRYEIDSYTRQLQTYDNLVNYTTITIYLQEVSVISPAKSKGFGTKVWEALQGSLSSFLSFLQGLVIVLIYLLPFAVIGLGIFFLCRYFYRKSAPKRAAKAAERAAWLASHPPRPMGPMPGYAPAGAPVPPVQPPPPNGTK